jgi:hypothetical protein
MFPFEFTSGRRNLVIARVGDESLHNEWLTPSESRNFDLCLSYSGEAPGRYADQCDFYFAASGTKWPQLYDLMRDYGELIMQYDAIWFPDDDIRTNAGNINRMFNQFNEHQLQLAQPALRKNAFYYVTSQYIDYELRYTHFVDTMAPIFSKDALRLCWFTFSKNLTGWGLEYIWPKLLNNPDKKIAILDAVPILQTRPSKREELYNHIRRMFAYDVDFNNEIQILLEYGLILPDPQLITFYDGIKKWKMPPLPSVSKPSAKKRKKKLRIPKKSNPKWKTKQLSIKKTLKKIVNRQKGMHRILNKMMKAAA